MFGKLYRRLFVAISWRYNSLKFRIFTSGVKVGRNFKVLGRLYVNIDKTATVEVGDDFVFLSGGNLNPLVTNRSGCIVADKHSRIKIGDNCGLSSTILWSRKGITLGNNVKIGGDVVIMDSDAHSLNYLDRRNGLIDVQNRKDAEIVIGDDVLIGARSISLKGVHIGARSVIGAGSVVVKDIPANCIAAGNPCRVIKENK